MSLLLIKLKIIDFLHPLMKIKFDSIKQCFIKKLVSTLSMLVTYLLIKSMRLF